jgi:CheY-like chemotaxis protein
LAGERVLVIEDKPEMIQILTDYVLSPQGYVTLTALNGEEGLRMALTEEPDLVIVDLRMPKMSGLQVLQSLRERQYPIPVIVITAYGSEEVVVRALRLGASDYIAKPFELDEAIAVIERVLSKSKAEKALGDRQIARSRRAIERKFNPYISGGPVREPDMFFGREELLKRIINTLHNNSIMIHGPRRIGKTSLLYQLAARLRATSDPDHVFIPALIDLEGTAQAEFFHTLMEEILEDCQPYLTKRLPLVYNEKSEVAYTHRDSARDLRTLIGHFQQNSNKEVRLILLLDEVDVMNRYDQLVQQQLRRIFMKTFARNLGAVVAGVHISKEWERLESPWYNLFLEMELPPLSRKEAIRLIKEPVKGVYSYEDEAVEAIWQYSQGHPQLVQQLCLEAVNRLLQEKRSRVTKADVESVYREIMTWKRVQEEREERERSRPPVKRVAEEGSTYEAEEDTDVRRDDG